MRIPTNEIKRLVEASVEELLAYDLEEPKFPALEFYRQALLAFHRGDCAALERLCAEQKAQPPPLPELVPLVELRWQILAGQVSASYLAQVDGVEWEKDWVGEIQILLAASHEVLGDFVSAREHHRKAAAALLKIGAKGKSLRARSNMVANLSNIEPDRKLIPEYLSIYKAAKKLRQHNIMATCLLNLSREYQKVGALKVALRYGTRAIAACKNDLGGQIYYLAILHRAHLLFDLGRTMEAKTELELARAADFPVVRSAYGALAEIMGGTASARPEFILRTWAERLRDFQKDQSRVTKLSPVEESLIAFLASGPKEKFAITDHLFGKDLHPLKAENRLKNLVHRVRKKFPGLIHFDHDHYSLADAALPTKGRVG